MPSADQLPTKNTHSIVMRWHEWVVLTAGSTGSALRAVRPPNLHKSFEADLHKDSAPTMQLVQGLPMPEERGGRGGRGLDAKAFEPNVKDYDRLLDQRLKTICKGC
jgi:hypothetical protein